jgi:hypothetical protein
VIARQRRRREVNRGEPRGQHPVHLLGKWLVAVAGAEAGLHVTRGDFLQVRGERGGERRHGVALHQQDVRAYGSEERRQVRQHAGHNRSG